MNIDNDSRYIDLTIAATSPTTDMWLLDTDGHLVQQEAGELRTSLLPGEYVVEFKLGTTTYPVSLHKPAELNESEITSGSSCPRPRVRFQGIFRPVKTK